MLAETIEVLFTNPRDQRLYRVLRAAYLTSELKQETAAYKLGPPIATYRRHLTAVVSRIVAWLWRQEHRAAPPGHAAELKSCRAGFRSTSADHRLSLVILPFLKLSRDSTAGFLADSIADNLPTDLSLALPGGFVIACSTAFTCSRVTIREVGQQLHERYVLEGGVVVDSGRIRVNAQLIDAEADAHLWAERFDKEDDDLLQIHDEIVARLARSVSIQMIRREAAQSCAARCLDATDLVLCGEALFEFRLQANAARAVSLFRQALAPDRKNVDAMEFTHTLRGADNASGRSPG
jgi:TolB-like protein